jgi:hypothetical protein
MFSGSMKGFKASGSIGFDEASGAKYYKTGGRVAKTGQALVHAGEYILPKGVKPTAEQKKQVRDIKCKCKK